MKVCVLQQVANDVQVKEDYYAQIGRICNTKPEMEGKYYNLWSTDNERTDANDDKVIKSVYDPSPVGYSLPASNAFTGFTTTGGTVNNQSDLFNVKGEFDKGWYFYTKQNKTGQILFFHASGYRVYNSGALDVFSRNGYYWTAGQSSITSGMLLFFTSSHVLPLYNFERYLGFNVRSAEEKVFKCWLQKLQMMHRLAYTVFHCNSIQLTKRLTL